MNLSGRGTLAVVAVLVLVGIGLCIFDVPMTHVVGPGHGHDSPHDLCLGMVALTLGVIPLVRPLPSGWARPVRALAIGPVAIQVVDPPPRS